MTILAILASAIGDQRAPTVKLLDQIGGKMLTVEVVVTFALAILGMSADKGAGRRKRRLEQRNTDAEESENNKTSTSTKPD